MTAVGSFSDERWAWHNGEPLSWKVDGGQLTVVPAAGLDYWSRTFYGPDLLVKSDAPSLLTELVPGVEASLTTAFTLYPSAQFDQAGVMILVEDEDGDTYKTSAWVKAGIEFTDGHPNVSCVVTNNGFSDWSTQRIELDGSSVQGGAAELESKKVSIRVRVTKHLPGEEQGPCVTMEVSEYHKGDMAESPGDWRQVRIASLRGKSTNSRWKMGVFSISPVAQNNSRVEFHHILLGPKIQPVHSAEL